MPRYLLVLGLGCEDDGVVGDHPIGSGTRAKAGGGAGSRRRRTTKNITAGGRSSLRRLGISLYIFGDGGRISMAIGSDRREGSEAMEEAEASI